LLADQRNRDREGAAECIGTMKGLSAPAARQVVSILAGHLTDRRWDVVVASVQALGDLALEPEIAVPALTKMLNGVDEVCRAEAAFALGKFGARAESAIPSLERALQSGYERTREGAAKALREIPHGTLEKHLGETNTVEAR
jgi:HEAT repeat protein